jgi:DNA-binding transcriptional MerR regulator
VKQYRVQAFAQLAAVTVRALHHYDRLGLLKPCRTDARYRLYTDRDLERLEQIVALQFLGIPLKQIGKLLDGRPTRLAEALASQRHALERKRDLLNRAILAIREAEKQPEPAVLKRIIEVMTMQNNMDWSKYYTGEAAAKLAERQKQNPWTPELQEQVTRDWTELYREVEAILDQNPAGEKAQALAARWRKLVDAFTGGDPDLYDGVRKVYADRANWPPDFQQQMAPFRNPRVVDFMRRAGAFER